MVLLVVLKNSNNSECGAPYFSHPKPKTNRVHFLIKIRNLNNQLKHKPHSMTKINEMFLKMEGFNYAASLDFVVK